MVGRGVEDGVGRDVGEDVGSAHPHGSFSATLAADWIMLQNSREYVSFLPLASNSIAS